VTTPPSWSVVIPVKVLAHGKSRLAELAGPSRPVLALAVAADTIRAVLACRDVNEVIVVTDDPVAAAEFEQLGAQVIGDDPDAGLNPALVHGARLASRRLPQAGIAAMSGDLPALKPAELGRALRAAARWREAFVPDASGTGTTLYATRPGVPFRPRFGPGSRRHHLDAGARELARGDVPGLRRDVDTPADLTEAARLGLGPATTALAASLLGSEAAAGTSGDQGSDEVAERDQDSGGGLIGRRDRDLDPGLPADLGEHPRARPGAGGGTGREP
jgi:2-phospho-L-lactate guanylyltransferase